MAFCYNATILKYSLLIVDHSPNVENINIVPYQLGLTIPYISIKSDHSANVDNIHNLSTQ